MTKRTYSADKVYLIEEHVGDIYRYKTTIKQTSVCIYLHLHRQQREAIYSSATRTTDNVAGFWKRVKIPVGDKQHGIKKGGGHVDEREAAEEESKPPNRDPDEERECIQGVLSGFV